MNLQPLTTARLQLVPPFLEYLDVGGADFDLKPEAAIKYFQAKGLKTTYAWQEMIGTEHSKAFTVAKMMDVDLLGLVRKELDHFIAEGGSFNDFKKTLTPILQQHGWWGKGRIIDQVTGATVGKVQLGSAWRLATIFRTNMQSAYAVGHWQQIVINAGEAPYLMYDAVDDHRTRPEHARLDEKVLRWDDPFWKTHYPPNGWNCRCSVMQLSKKQVEDMGLKLGKAPKITRRKWVNPVTGEKRMVPVDLDPGWDYNPGIGTLDKHQKLLAEKIAKLPEDMKKAAEAGLAKHSGILAAHNAKVAASKANAQLAKAIGTRQLERNIQRAKQKAIDLKAEAELQAVAAGVAEDPGNFKKNAYKQLINKDGFKAGTVVEQHEQLLALAAKLKHKHGLQTKLSAYKKKILLGKNPTPAQQEAFKIFEVEYPEELAKMQATMTKELAQVNEYKGGLQALGVKVTDKHLTDFLKLKKAEKAAAIKANAKHLDELEAASAPAVKVADEAVELGDDYLDTRKFQQVGGQAGSNRGGMYLDPDTNTKWYIKYPASEDVARNEYLAGALYEAAGIEVPTLMLVKGADGAVGIASKIIDDVVNGSRGLKQGRVAGVGEGFAVDAWLANWDVVGLSFDNMLVKAGRAIRLDTGGALRYRAQGGLKGAAWGKEVTELDTLLDTGRNSQAASVFKHMTKEQLETGVRKVLAITDDDIRRLVKVYGPVDAKVADDLIDVLIARKQYLAKKYPHLAEQPKPALTVSADRVTPGEWSLVNESRGNGYVIKTDKGDIEDQSALFWRSTAADGTERVSASLKIRSKAADHLDEMARQAGGLPGGIDLGGIDNKFITAIKGVAYRAGKGVPFEQKDIQRINDARDALADIEVKLLDSKYYDDAVAAAVHNHYKPWLERLEKAVKKPKANNVPDWPADTGHFGGFKMPKPTLPESQVQGITFTKVQSNWHESEIVNGRLRQTDRVGYSKGYVYEADVDGALVRYWDNTDSTPFALRGQLEIHVPGGNAKSAAKVYKTLDDLEIDTSRPGALDREELYLTQIAYHERSGWSDFKKALRTKDQEKRVEKMRAAVSKSLGVDDVTKLPEYNPAGNYQAYGHGRTQLYRPDLNGTEWEKFSDEYRLYHRLYSGDVVESIDRILNSGGVMVPTTDKLRRGITPRGMSPDADLGTGGASYFFTRIQPKRTAYGSQGLVWKVTPLKRLDGISYNGDKFGQVTTERFVQTNRHTGIDEWRKASRAGSNETIFKNGLSLFDDLDAINVRNQAEYDRMLEVLKKHGLEQWPDGRALNEVVRISG